MNIVRNYPAHYLNGSYEVKIVAVETPCRIYVTLTDELISNQEILDTVRGYRRSELNKILEEEIYSGSPVFVAIANEFHRGAILDRTFTTDAIRVWLGDYAIEVTVTLEDLYVMPEVFRFESWQTLACGLAGIQPVQGEKWSNDTCEALRDSIVGCRIILRTLYPDETCEAVWADLVYNDAQRGLVSLIDELVEIGHAEKASRQVGFDWGDGIGSISDRRRSEEMQRKWSLQRALSTVRAVEQPAGRELPPPVRSETIMAQPGPIHEVDEIPDNLSLSNESLWYDDQPGIPASQRPSMYNTSLDSCGESGDESDYSDALQ